MDVERGRMVPGWRPRRFGGGLGGRGYTKQAPAKPTFGGSGPPGGPGGHPGGFRGGFGGRGGGFRGGFRGDRGGYGGRGGIGYQGGGGFGGRQGGHQNGAPPLNAPSGPGGRPSYDDRRNGYGGGREQRGMTGSNRDPIGGRDRGYEDRDRDRDRERDRDRDRDRDRYGGGRRDRDEDHGSRKRYHDGDGYDDPRTKRRY